MSKKTPSEYARLYVERFGMALVPIEPGRKFPTANDWGKTVIDEPSRAAEYWHENNGWSMGVALGPSGFCSLDIDCAESFATILEEFGIPASELDSFPTIQGSPKGRRVMFRVPGGVELPYCKVNWPTKGDQKKKFTVFELRAAADGKQRQDVLPPSLHPETLEPYKWLVQPAKSREDWPEPPAWLLSIWEAFDSFKPQLIDACPWLERKSIEAPKPSEQRSSTDGPTPIDEHLRRVSLTDALHQYGYKRKGKRWLSPHSGTGLPGVMVFDHGQSCWICHASDPLCSEDSGKPVNAFDLYCEYEHSGDVSAAVKQLAKDYDMQPKPKPRASALSAEEAVGEPPVTPSSHTANATRQASAGGPFMALGYNGKHYYYLPRGTEQVATITRSGHTSAAEMLALAPIEWWEMNYPKGNGNGIDWQHAASSLMRLCERKGIYSQDRVRGRGAWYDDGKSVFHLGDALLVSGERKAISDHDSKFIYTKQAAMELPTTRTPASDETGEQVKALIGDLAWAKPVHAIIAAGWLALAPVCGALKWRPHIWLTAPRGAGKSWALDNIMAPILGPAALVAQGATTEAGIRQLMRQDARPVMFDEAEAEGVAGAKRIQNVIELARQASSDSTAEIVKGSSGGEAMAFRMRSMFMMQSINVSLSQAADESRFSVIQLGKPSMSSTEFAQFADKTKALLTDESCASIRARSYLLIPAIRESAKTLAAAVCDVIGSQRIGDQMGALLAGYWHLSNKAAITPSQAATWVASLDFDDAREAEQVNDSDSLLAQIMEHQLTVDSSGARVTRSVIELVSSAAGDGVGSFEDNEVLARHGMTVRDDALLVSNTHRAIKAMLKDTAWASGWRTVLARTEGATKTPNPVRIGLFRTRAVVIPLGTILN